MINAHPWEIWWAYVEFDEGDDGKERPVLILEDGKVYVIALMITSHEQRNNYGEYDITKWQSAGLKKPSTIRVTRKLELSENICYKRWEIFSRWMLHYLRGICRMSKRAFFVEGSPAA